MPDTGVGADEGPAAESRERRTLYFDHAASSWPKPDVVVDAVHHAVADLAGNPGRGAYRMAVELSREIFSARRFCAQLIGASRGEDVIFTPGCTAACNMMLKGTLRTGDRVVVGATEHNAVARPLAALQAIGVEVVKVAADEQGRIEPDAVRSAVAQAPTRAVVCQHASNVTGAIQPIAEIAAIAHEAGALMLCDGAQGVGHLEIDVVALGVDAYAMSGHKALLGPQGIGLLYLNPELEVDELLEGGTGSHSESLEMPTRRPDRYEPGTPNTPGILGLGAAAEFVAAEGATIRAVEADLLERLGSGILEMGGYRVLGPSAGEPRVPLLSVVPDARTSSELASRLDRDYGIACRAGLHCAPWAHEAVGTLETGACRFGIGYGIEERDVDVVLGALEELR